MKVLWVGNYHDGTGWARASLDYALALDAAGADVVLRPLRLNRHQGRLPERALELESRPSAGCDAVVQHALPHLMDYNGRFRQNVGLFVGETSDFRASGWAEHLNTMDAVWVANGQQVDACRQSGVERPVAVVPHACDTARYEQSHGELEALKKYKHAGEFLFYTIGELVSRKNLAALLKAFHLEFDPSEPVRLVIKTSGGEEAQAAVSRMTEDLKRGLRLHGGRPELYKDEVVLLDRLTDEGVMRLHETCDVFVQPSRGESWGIPAFDAMALGKTPIVTACTGYTDYLSDEEGWLVHCRPEPVLEASPAPAGLYCGLEHWWEVDLLHLRRCMRQAYEDEELRAKKAQAGMARAYDFSYEEVGRRMRGLLEGEKDTG